MIVDVIAQTLMISAFVFVMLLLIEYINTHSYGAAERAIRGGRWRQYLVAVGLGATPGCLGAFACVSLFVHGLLSLGALAGCMVATSGDEAFVLLAMDPWMGLFLMAILFVVGLTTAWVADRLCPQWDLKVACSALIVHDQHACGRSSWAEIAGYWQHCSAHRGILASGLLVFIGAVSVGEIGPQQWNWIRMTLLLVSLFTLFVVATVSDHFLEEHLWEHVARKHVPRIFFWTLVALLLTRLAGSYVSVEHWIQRNPFTLLFVAGLLGLVPESGPHLVFVTLYIDGSIPFSVLLTSSIVQDGHGTLPLLGNSLKAFAMVKVVNLVIGLLIGLAVFAVGW
jgi:hypothetical protein